MEDKELSSLLRWAVAAASNFVIIDELNLPHVDWEHAAGTVNTLEGELVKWMHVNALVQHVNFRTHRRIGRLP